MIRKIIHAKFANVDNTEVFITFANGTTVRHFIDDVMREHTSSYLTFIEGGGTVEPFETEEERIARLTKEKIDAIGTYIYSHYSEQNQSQDRGYQAYAQTVIVGMSAQTDNPVTLDALTVEIMGVVLQIFAEEVTLADYVATKPTDLQEHYEKLIKIGMRLKWTKACIDEGKLAIAENRDPDYPPYPNFEGGAA